MDETDDWYSAGIATFGDRVAGAREAAGLTQPELARRLGVKTKTLRDWENDISEPRANKLQMLSGLLSVSLMWLLNGEGEGIAAPLADAAATTALHEVLGEVKTLQDELNRAQAQVARIEKRLSALVANQEDPTAGAAP